jgi:hypothetical protein
MRSIKSRGEGSRAERAVGVPAMKDYPFRVQVSLDTHMPTSADHRAGTRRSGNRTGVVDTPWSVGSRQIYTSGTCVLPRRSQ